MTGALVIINISLWYGISTVQAATSATNAQFSSLWHGKGCPLHTLVYCYSTKKLSV